MGTNRPSDLQGSLQRDGDGDRIGENLSSALPQEATQLTTPDHQAAFTPSGIEPARRRGRSSHQSAGVTPVPLSSASASAAIPLFAAAARLSRRRLFNEQDTSLRSHVGQDTLKDPGVVGDHMKVELIKVESKQSDPSTNPAITSKSDQLQSSESTSSSGSTFSNMPHKTVPFPQGSSASDLCSSGMSSSAVRMQAARHQCPKCPKTFGSPGKLSQHMYSHTGERPFACQFCPKAFSSKFKLVRHMLIHSDQRQYTCQMCDRTFHRKDHLKNHAKVHNPVKSIYICDRPGCDKEYSSLLSYRKHIAVHAAEDGNLECTMCGLKFSNKDEIVFHLKVHAGSRTVKTAEDRKYRCDHCDRSFFTGKDVRRHMVVHTGKRDFLCQFCPQRFGRKDHLVRHIKKSHNSTGKKAKTKRTEAKTKSVESILVETGRSKIQESDTTTSKSSKPATITSGDLFSSVSQESSLMVEFEDTRKDACKQDVFQTHYSEEHGCVVMITSSASSQVVDSSHGVEEQLREESTSYISTSTSSSQAQITVVEISQCVTVPSSTTIDVISCRNLLSSSARGTDIGITSSLVYAGNEVTSPEDPRHQHTQATHHSQQHLYQSNLEGNEEVAVGSSAIGLTSENSSHHLHHQQHQEQFHPHRHGSINDEDTGAVSTTILTPVDAHSFDQPAASSSSSSSYSAMIDSFGLELKPEDLDDLKPSDLDLKAEDLELKPGDIEEVSESPTAHRDTALESDITMGNLPLLLPILPRPHEEHLHHEMQANHFLAPDETRNISRHIINLTTPGAASGDSELIVGLPDFDIRSGSDEAVDTVHQDAQPVTSNAPSNTIPLPRFNQAFQQPPQ